MSRLSLHSLTAPGAAIACIAWMVSPCVLPSPVRAADATWEMLAGPVDPQPTWGARAIHDERRQRMVVLDPMVPERMMVVDLPGTDGSSWRYVPIAGVPPAPRFEPSVVYDSLGDRAILFGGRVSDRKSCNDVWAVSLGDAPQWTPLLPEGRPPLPRDDHAAILDPVRYGMVVYGGTCRDSNQVLSDVWLLSLSGAPAWMPVAPVGLAPGPHAGGSAIYDPWAGRMVFVGGDNTVWTLSLAAAPAWDSLPVASPRPAPRLTHALVLDAARRRVILHGGTKSDHWGSVLSDAWALALDGAPAWTPIDTSGAGPGVMQQAAIYSPERGTVIEFGGSPSPYLNMLEEFDPGMHEWSRMLPVALDGTTPVRRGFAVANVEPSTGQLRIYGGLSPACLTDLWAFDPGTRAWRQECAIEYTTVCQSSYYQYSFVHDTRRNRLLALHGDAYWGRTENRIFALPLDGCGGWTELVHAGLEPLGRDDPSLVYDPVRDRVLMFGGVIYGTRAADSGNAQDDVWALSMGDTVRWTQLAPHGSPGRRDGHGAAYDGRRDRMVVFGGETQTMVLLGDTRQPLYDTWALSLAGDSLAWGRLSATAGFHGLIAVDSLRDRLVGWSGGRDVWVLPFDEPDGWRRLAVSGDVPSPRGFCGLTFDGTRSLLYAYAGMLALQWDAWSDLYSTDLYVLRFTEPGSIVLRGAYADWDRVTLAWEDARAGEALSVVRATNDTVWTRLAGVVSDDSGHITFTDTQVVPGGRFGYALAYPGSDLRYGQTTVVVPPRPGLALDGLRPNPSPRQVSVSLALPDAMPARLEAFDVGGRRVASRELSGLGPGRHVVSLEEGRVWPPGLYFLKLTHRGRTLTARGVILR
jgi:hypothetical protein